ncbi:MAG: hypothetical protein LBQ84_09850 [Flavobacteriaceae bacterium]|jgi:hypothetical protein|nr:hypothetical protein [Flavobacteriaceae bacterium]
MKNNWILQTGGKYDWNIYEEDILKYTLDIKVRYNILKAHLNFYKEIEGKDEIILKLTCFYFLCYEKMKIIDSKLKSKIELKKVKGKYCLIIDDKDIVEVKLLGFPYRKKVGEMYINAKRVAEITYSFISKKHFKIVFDEKDDLNVFGVFLLLTYVFNNGAD